jgi:hypothetical protein
MGFAVQKFFTNLNFKVLCLIPFISLIKFNELIYPTVTGKNFAFSVLIDVSLILAAISPMRNINLRKFSISKISVSLIFFTLAISLADFFGENFFNSFWSNYSRMEGLVTYIYLLFYFLLLVGFLENRREWFIYFNCILLVIFFVLRGNFASFWRFASHFSRARGFAFWKSNIFFNLLRSMLFNFILLFRGELNE